MDPIFERLETLLKSMFQDLGRGSYRSTTSGDPDMKEAWEELDDFLKGEKGREKTEGSGSGNQQRDRSENYYGNRYQNAGPDEELRKDFQSLEVPFGSSLETVKKSYKVLLRKYHPDLHASNPEKLKHATEVTQKLNLAYQRIETYYEKKKKL